MASELGGAEEKTPSMVASPSEAEKVDDVTVPSTVGKSTPYTLHIANMGRGASCENVRVFLRGLSAEFTTGDEGWEVTVKRGSRDQSYAFIEMPPQETSNTMLVDIVNRCRGTTQLLDGSPVTLAMATPTNQIHPTKEEKQQASKLRAERKAERKAKREYKTRECYSWDRDGSCTYGDACKFVHDRFVQLQYMCVCDPVA